MIKINGVELPTPTDFTAGVMDISDAERNTAGIIHIKRIATKRKLELGWPFMSDTDLKKVLDLVSSTFFTVEYPDPQTGNRRTGVFYVGDRTMGALDYKNGRVRWKDIKFNLIER